MNILDYKKNPLYRIIETVKMEAKRYGVHVTSSEVVGLIPVDCITDSLRYYFAVEGHKLPKDITMDQICQYAIEILKFRDFDIKKIIEANL